jgi:hypothetical protein
MSVPAAAWEGSSGAAVVSGNPRPLVQEVIKRTMTSAKMILFM